jgi:hypothetical protein
VTTSPTWLVARVFLLWLRVLSLSARLVRSQPILVLSTRLVATAWAHPQCLRGLIPRESPSTGTLSIREASTTAVQYTAVSELVHLRLGGELSRPTAQTRLNSFFRCADYEGPWFAWKEFSVGLSRGYWRGRTAGTVLLALLVMGFPGAVECCNYVVAYLKDGLPSSP